MSFNEETVAMATEIRRPQSPTPPPAARSSHPGEVSSKQAPGVPMTSLAPSVVDSGETPRTLRSQGQTQPPGRPAREPFVAGALIGAVVMLAALQAPALIRGPAHDAWSRLQTNQAEPDRPTRPSEPLDLPLTPPEAFPIAVLESNAMVPSTTLAVRTPGVSKTSSVALANPRRSAESELSNSETADPPAKATSRDNIDTADVDTANLQALRDYPPFNVRAASNAIRYYSRSLTRCHDPALGRISTRAAVTFVPSGHVTQVVLDPVLSMKGSPVVGCVVRELREALVPEFAGDRVTVHAMVTVE